MWEIQPGFRGGKEQVQGSGGQNSIAGVKVWNEKDRAWEDYSAEIKGH